MFLRHAQQERRANPLGKRYTTSMDSFDLPRYNHIVTWADIDENCDCCRVLWKNYVREVGLRGKFTFSLCVAVGFKWIGSERYRVPMHTLGVAAECDHWPIEKYILTFDAVG